MSDSSRDPGFNERVRAVLAPHGITFDGGGRFHVVRGYSGDVAEAERLVSYFNDIQPSRSVQSRVKLGWTRDFCETINRILADDSTDPSALRTVFYLRLHGLVVDFTASASLFRGALENEPAPGGTLSYLWNVLKSIEAMRNVLTEDEQLWAEYRRHADAHILQRGYELQWNKGKLKDTQKSKFTGGTYDVRDLETRLIAVVRRYGHESAIAPDFARRLNGPAQQVLAAMTAFCSGVAE